MAASTRIMRSTPTCLSCLRRIAQPGDAALTTTSPMSFTQIRGEKTLTKAELEDLQGTPVRLLRDMPGFGRKHALIRIKPGRMRNYFFPKGQAEYLTRQRFQELGLTMANVGVRDRTFGSKLVVDKKKDGGKAIMEEKPASHQKKATLTLPAEETKSLLEALLEPTLVFARKPIEAQAPATTPAAPAVPRSPSLAANAAASTGPSPEEVKAKEEAAALAAKTAPIFGSVSAGDVLALIREKISVDDRGARVALEADHVAIVGLAPGEDRIKNLGTSFAVEIVPGKGIEPVRRAVHVVPE